MRTVVMLPPIAFAVALAAAAAFGVVRFVASGLDSLWLGGFGTKPCFKKNGTHRQNTAVKVGIT